MNVTFWTLFQSPVLLLSGLTNPDDLDVANKLQCPVPLPTSLKGPIFFLSKPVWTIMQLICQCANSISKLCLVLIGSNTHLAAFLSQFNTQIKEEKQAFQDSSALVDWFRQTQTAVLCCPSLALNFINQLSVQPDDL